MGTEFSPPSETFTYEIDSSESIDEAVLTAVSAVTGADRTPQETDGNDTASPALDPLYTVIDPDALEALFQPIADGPHRDGSVQFRYAGCEVTVRSNGRIRVRPAFD